jgi:hypothetical protein
MVAFKPEPGTRVADMAQTLKSSNSPLENEEFYNTLEHLGDHISHPPPDIAKEVLQYALLDAETVPGFLILSGCNTSIRDVCADEKGRYVRDTSAGVVTSGFIAISLTTKTAFYALDSGPPSGMYFYPEETCGAPHSVAVFPSKHDWPPELLKALDSWITDETCG